MDVTSLISGIMIGAGIGLAFCTAIIYAHHRDVILKKGKADLWGARPRENLKDDAKEDSKEVDKARR